MTDNDKNVIQMHPEEEGEYEETDFLNSMQGYHAELAKMSQVLDSLAVKAQDNPALFGLIKQLSGNLFPMLQEMIETIGDNVELALSVSGDGDEDSDQDTGLSDELLGNIGAFLHTIISIDSKLQKKPETIPMLKRMAKEVGQRIREEVPNFEELLQTQLATTAQVAAEGLAAVQKTTTKKTNDGNNGDEPKS